MQRLLADASELSGKEYNIDNLGDVYEAIHVIQEDLGLTGVAAEEAETTFSGSLGSMKAAATNLMADLANGANIGPDLISLGNTVKTFVVGNLLPMIGNIASQIPTILAQLPTFIAGMLPDVIASGADIVAGFAAGIVDNIPTFVAGLGSLFGSIWTAITNIDWTSAGLIVVDLLGAAWDGLTTIASGIWDTVVGYFTGDIEFPDISEGAKTVWNALSTKASEVWTSVKAWFTKTFTWPNISDAAKLVWNKLTTAASEIWTAVKTWFTKTFQFPSLDEVAKTAWNSLTTIASTIWTAIKTWFTKTFQFPSLADAAYTAWSSLTTLAQTIWDAIVNWFTSTFDFPSLDELAKAAWDGLTDIAGGIWDGIKGIFGSFGDDFEIASIATDTATAAWDTLKTAATTVWDGVKGIFGAWPADFKWPDFGEMAKGALEGLKSAAEGVWNWVKDLFSGDEDSEAVKSVQGSTTEMATALADAELKVSAVDVSSIQEANTFLTNTVLGWMRIFDGMSTWLKLPTVKSDSLVAAHQVISSWVSTYKRKMEFSWTLPTLHGWLPIISVNMREATSSDGKTSVSYPELSKSGIKWFARGAVFNNPTIIGIGDSRGPEAAVPLNEMWRQMGREFDDHLGTGATIYQTYNVNGASDPDAWAMSVARTIKRELRMT